jgi:hypothetical protein
MRKRRDEGKDMGDLVGPLVEAVHEAIKIEPELTVAHIEMIYLPFEKAMMLAAAASALAGPVPVQKNPTHENRSSRETGKIAWAKIWRKLPKEPRMSRCLPQ